jgi:hypothetical protein
MPESGAYSWLVIMATGKIEKSSGAANNCSFK